MALVTKYIVQNGNSSIEFSNQADAETYATQNNLDAPQSFEKNIEEIPIALLPIALPSYASDPLAVTAGVYFNTTLGKIRFYTGSSWETINSQ
jgi:hypothetical protein